MRVSISTPIKMGYVYARQIDAYAHLKVRRGAMPSADSDRRNRNISSCLRLCLDPPTSVAGL